MVLLMWGWVHQRITFRFRPTVWKKRYLVITTMSIHVHKSEKGVISSLFPDNLPTVHVWSNFRSANSYLKRGASNTFMIEPKEPNSRPLKFKCVTSEEKEKWLSAIREQLSLTSKIWSHSMSTMMQPKKHTFDRKILSVSVLDKWLDQLAVIDTSSLIRQQQKALLRTSSSSRKSSTSSKKRRSSVPTIPKRSSLDLARYGNGNTLKMQKITAIN
ncbi:hypothetical protein HPULCUR_007174 [Helicostylum pulchrum]|uniref:PH domain-containing protein n=1 Tax=Helicostylum pulchrum TaxID=562976 RepID=A0ABP9Y3Z4_9FUNG